MNTLKQLTKLSAQLTDLLDDLERTLDYIDNTELYSEIDNNVKSQLENALTHLDIACDDVSEGMYEDDPISEDFEEWD
jgi:BMFP domain-containing protein YqiC